MINKRVKFFNGSIVFLPKNIGLQKMPKVPVVTTINNKSIHCQIALCLHHHIHRQGLSHCNVQWFHCYMVSRSPCPIVLNAPCHCVPLFPWGRVNPNNCWKCDLFRTRYRLRYLRSWLKEMGTDTMKVLSGLGRKHTKKSDKICFFVCQYCETKKYVIILST